MPVSRLNSSPILEFLCRLEKSTPYASMKVKNLYKTLLDTRKLKINLFQRRSLLPGIPRMECAPSSLPSWSRLPSSVHARVVLAVSRGKSDRSNGSLSSSASTWPTSTFLRKALSIFARALSTILRFLYAEQRAFLAGLCSTSRLSAIR